MIAGRHALTRRSEMSVMSVELDNATDDDPSLHLFDKYIRTKYIIKGDVLSEPSHPLRLAGGPILNDQVEDS